MLPSILRSRPRIAIVGSGVSGIYLSRLLSVHCSVEIFEKSWKYSGRAATLSLENCHIDHGAPYFSLRATTFNSLSSILRSSLLPLHSRVVAHESNERIPSRDGHCRYYMRNGNNTLGRLLLENVNGTEAHKVRLRQGHFVQRIERDGRLQIRLEEKALCSEQRTASSVLTEENFDAVVLTAPLEQSATVINNSASNNSKLEHTNAKAHDACLTGVFAYDKRKLPTSSRIFRQDEGDVYMRVCEDDVLQNATIENRKTGRVHNDDVIVIVARGASEFSNNALLNEMDTNSWMSTLQERAEEMWEIARNNGAFVNSVPKKWRFANVKQEVDMSAHSAAKYPAQVQVEGVPTFLCGDSFGGGICTFAVHSQRDTRWRPKYPQQFVECGVQRALDAAVATATRVSAHFELHLHIPALTADGGCVSAR